ncbi:MAG: Na+/H+ antiporter subunit E [Planctomycetota bacterium]
MKEATISLVNPQSRLPLGRAARRALLFAALWWVLTEGRPDSWIIGGPAVVAAALASAWLSPGASRRLSLRAAVGFVAFFAVESLRAGFDVAWRAVTLDIAPAMVSYPLSLRDTSARVLFAGSVSLLPGTVTAGIEKDTLHVHSLDTRQRVSHELRRIERHVGALFDERI